MFSVSFVGPTQGISQSTITSIQNIALAAGNYWARYLDLGNANLQIEINFDDLGDSVLASAGPVLFFDRIEAGNRIFEPGTIIEINTGNDPNPQQSDIFITINNTDILDNTFFLGDFSSGEFPSVPNSQIDLFATLVHEIGHGLGFLSFLDGTDNTRSTFDLLVNQSGSNFTFIGQNAVSVFGGPVPLTNVDPSHFATSIVDILGPFIPNGQRTLISRLDIALFEDLGIPILRPTNSDDRLFGFEDADTINLASGNDIYDGEAGNDLIRGNSGFDTLVGGSGNDTLLGNFNADRLIGGAGNDELSGGSGRDALVGGSGNDIITGEDGNDVLIGNSGFDTLNGGTGNDTLQGGGNVDFFVFENNFGQDTVNDFAVANRFEKIDLSAVTAITDFVDLIDNHLSTNSNGDAVISVDGNSITLLNVSQSSLSVDDFIF